MNQPIFISVPEGDPPFNLRDLFAAYALNMFAGPDWGFGEAVKGSYEVADMMMEERKK